MNQGKCINYEDVLSLTKQAEKINKNDETKLIDYFNRLSLKNNFSTLIIIYKEGKPSKGLITAIKRMGIAVNFSVTDKAKLASWIKSKFMQSNKKISQEALFYLQSIAGSDLGLSLIHISEPTRLGMISYAVFCLKKKKKK